MIWGHRFPSILSGDQCDDMGIWSMPIALISAILPKSRQDPSLKKWVAWAICSHYYIRTLPQVSSTQVQMHKFCDTTISTIASFESLCMLYSASNWTLIEKILRDSEKEK